MLTLSPNRVSRAIEATQARIDERLDSDGVASLDATLALEGDEHFRFQQTQAQAHALQRLTTDEAHIVYVALGEVGSATNGGWADGTSLATKVVVTQLMGELLAR